MEFALHTTCYSPSILQIAESAYRSPETTKPWVIVLRVGNPGEESHIDTSMFDSGKEVAHDLASSRTPILHILCLTANGSDWVLRSIREVWIGTLGEAAVAVFLDDRGFEFCPDAPEQAVSQLSELICCGVVEGAQQTERPARGQSYGKLLHKAIEREVLLRQVAEFKGTKASAGQ